ncbi:MAG: S-layer homology domain-containing protein [Clostridia bacterium]|nr:S-layer homology domain-containing protein [Clostridia bacterium]
MKFFRKTLCAVLAVIMALPAVYGSAATNFKDVKSSAVYYDAVMSLSENDILKGYEDGSFGPGLSITRAEMAAIIVRMLGYEKEANDIKGVTDYYDVDSDHWASGYVNAATDLEIIQGDGDGYFRPEDNVLYEEAIKMVVEAAGYGALARKRGGYPEGYITVADAKDITKNISVIEGDDAVRSAVAMMVYAAMKDQVVTVATPVASRSGGSYKIYPTISLSTETKGAKIYYTTNGTTPTKDSKLYVGGISITSTQTLKAIAILDGVHKSEVMTEVYSIAARGRGTVSSKLAVTLDLNYEQAESSIIYTGKNKLMDEPEEPLRSGYDFDGWYTDAVCKDSFDFENTMITTNMILYAGWSEAAQEPVVSEQEENKTAEENKEPQENEEIKEPEKTENTEKEENKEPAEPVITYSVDADMSAFKTENGNYSTDAVISTLKGTASEGVEKVKITVKDATGKEVVSGEATVTDGKFEFSKLGLILGTNIVTVDGIKGDAAVASKEYRINNDCIQNIYNTNADVTDTDNDGIINYLEDYYGTDKTKADTDGDGLSDSDELNIHHTNALKADSDDDGLNDKKEIELGTKPHSSDSDTDGLNDSEEVTLGSDPLKADTDGDGLTDYEEAKIFKTNPSKADEKTVYAGKKDYYDATLSLSATVNVSCINYKAVSVAQTSAKAAGEIGGYIIKGNGGLSSINLTFEYGGNKTIKDKEFMPTIYSYADGKLTAVPSQSINGKKISATVKDFGSYIVIDKVAYEKALADAAAKAKTEETNKTEATDKTETQTTDKTVTEATENKGTETQENKE